MDQAPLYLSVLTGNASWVWGPGPGERVESCGGRHWGGGGGAAVQRREQPDRKARRTGLPSRSSTISPVTLSAGAHEGGGAARSPEDTSQEALPLQGPFERHNISVLIESNHTLPKHLQVAQPREWTAVEMISRGC